MCEEKNTKSKGDDRSEAMMRLDKEKEDRTDSMSVYGKAQYSSVQYSTVQYSTVQYSTVQYSTVQYSTVQLTNLCVYILLKL